MNNTLQRKYIRKFITAIIAENYSVANKYLQETIALKVKGKVADAKNIKLFDK